jgi:hypothetical protein
MSGAKNLRRAVLEPGVMPPSDLLLVREFTSFYI